MFPRSYVERKRKDEKEREHAREVEIQDGCMSSVELFQARRHEIDPIDVLSPENAVEYTLQPSWPAGPRRYRLHLFALAVGPSRPCLCFILSGPVVCKVQAPERERVWTTTARVDAEHDSIITCFSCPNRKAPDSRECRHLWRRMAPHRQSVSTRVNTRTRVRGCVRVLCAPVPCAVTAF
jgi:hypothetical protein